jgi:toxin ParE1/3/4
MTRAKRGSKTVPRIAWTARALNDLVEIDDDIAADDPVAAERWTARIVARAVTASKSPLAGRVVPERASEDVREVILRSYRIVYRVREHGVLVLTIFEGHRQVPSGLDAEG